ncbi:MAG: hypothetical protein PHQ86_01970 [Dehalococcoidales bacterium]|nr:hypothetical protein [Dehalococcoidales bacterium]
MRRELRFKPIADEQLTKLENTPALEGVLKQVRKILGYLETNLEANSLHIHPHKALSIRYNQKINESYVQQDTPGAYRVFWYYGKDELDKKRKPIPIITVVAITPHP